MAKWAQTATRFQMPVGDNAVLTQDYGVFNQDITDDIDNGLDYYHLGEDYDYVGVPEDELFIYSIANGTVVEVGTEGGGESAAFGNYIVIEHLLPDGTKLYSLYAHLSSMSENIEEGYSVKIGDQIGIMGESGQADGVHLHWEVSYKNEFTGDGDYANGYDSERELLYVSHYTVDPSDFVEKYDNSSTVFRDFPAQESVERVPSGASDNVSFKGDEVTISFEDLAGHPDAPGGVIYDGYVGLEWDNFVILDPEQGFVPYPSGYSNGTVSGDIVAVNSFANPATISDDDNDFDLVSGFFTAAWNDGLVLDVYAYDDGVMVGRDTIVLNTQAPNHHYFTENFLSIDKVRFESSGGVDAGLEGSGTNFAVDDLTIVVYDDFAF